MPSSIIYFHKLDRHDKIDSESENKGINVSNIVSVSVMINIKLTLGPKLGLLATVSDTVIDHIINTTCHIPGTTVQS